MPQISEERSEELKAKAISARRAARRPWQNAHVDRLAREREARVTAREYSKAQRTRTNPYEGVPAGTKRCSRCKEALPLDQFRMAANGHSESRCKPCKVVEVRESKQRKRLKGVTNCEAADAAGQVARLSEMLTGPRINSEQAYDMADAALRRAWLLSGDKQCVSCLEIVPPTAMLPPVAANSYPSHCRTCAGIAYETNHRRVFGPLVGPLLGPRKILMRDGPPITVAEFARRVEARRQGYRVTHFGA